MVILVVLQMYNHWSVLRLPRVASEGCQTVYCILSQVSLGKQPAQCSSQCSWIMGILQFGWRDTRPKNIDEVIQGIYH